MPLNNFFALIRIVHQTDYIFIGLAFYHHEFFLYLSSDSHLMTPAMIKYRHTELKLRLGGKYIIEKNRLCCQ